jgi:hypothetical protein
MHSNKTIGEHSIFEGNKNKSACLYIETVASLDKDVTIILLSNSFDNGFHLYFLARR